MDIPREFKWHGFAVVCRRPGKFEADFCALTAIRAGWQIDFAGRCVKDWDLFVRELLAGSGEHQPDRILVNGDSKANVYRAAAFAEDVLLGAVLIEPHPLVVARNWLVARLRTPLDPGESFRLLDGRPSGSMTPRGAVVCFCCRITHDEIVDAIGSGSTSVEAVGAVTRAGTHCGGCRPNIARLINSVRIGSSA